jgi:hypothetical protein
MQIKSWTDRVKNEEELHRVKEEKGILHTKQRKKTIWIGHILRRNCRLKHVIVGSIEEKIEVTGRRRRGCKELLMALRKRENTGNWKRKHQIALVENSLWKMLWTCRKTY